MGWRTTIRGAAPLYLRLGLGETACRYVDRYDIVTEAGERLAFSDPCRFLVKNLTQ